MTEDAALLFDVLDRVAAVSLLEPCWDASSSAGYVYPVLGSALEQQAFLDRLEALAAENYLERVFVERLSLCPTCDSHALNVHEICLSCSSSNLTRFTALFHFRCGFVGPETAFKAERDGLRCPKCKRILADVGTDHDSPGDYHRCQSCAAMFQLPDVGARCLSCGARFSRDAMETIKQRDVFAYRLTEIGRAALREKRLLEAAVRERD